MKPVKRKSLPLSRVYALIEPGPVVLLSTSLKGRANVMTLSWLTMIEFEPPLVGCVISDRNYSDGILKKTRECVINVPTVELSKQVVGCGNTAGRTTDKFAAFGLTPAPASRVAAPLIAECYANLECRVFDTGMPARYGFSSSRSSRPGSIRQARTRGRCTTAAGAASWSPGRRSSWRRR